MGDPQGPSSGTDPRPVPPLHVLIVEDEAADVRLLEEAFRGFPRPVVLHRTSTGDEAMRYLHRADGEGTTEPRPDVVLLDLNLPRKDGRSVLAEMRGDPRLNSIPVIVLTASRSEADVRHASAFHADAYLRKPVDRASLMAALEQIGPASGP